MRISFAKLIGSKAGFGFAAILLLAITLRFFDLDAREVWLDEAFSWNQASMGFAEMLSSVARDVHPPLYQAVLWVNTRIFGESPFALRLPSAIFSCIAVAMTYFFTCRISTKTAALLAMTFTTISTFQLWYAQEARMYSLLAMLTLGSMIMLLCLLKETSKRNLAGYILLSVLLLYTHVYGIFILLAQQFFYLYLWINKRCPAHLTLSCWIRVHLLIAISFLPWLWILIRQFTKIQNNFWIQQPGISDLQQTLNTYQSLPLIIFLGTVVLACAGLVKASINKDQADQFRSQYSGT
ncbi:MAG: glycosyltransferase family 39 protein, partial [Gammaproteobacteria bacterium]|nr:glycosyltransferase family 39 protein [Gammaproteobacteria bacterium]